MSVVQHTISKDQWTPITSAGQFGKCWLDENSTGNDGSDDIRIFHTSGVPVAADLAKSMRVRLPKSNSDIIDLFPDSKTDVFYARAGGDSIAVLSVDIAPAIGSPSRPIENAPQDPINDLVSLRLCQFLGNITLAAPTVVGGYTLSLVAGHGVVAGNVLCLKENGRYFQALVPTGGVSGNTITITTPIDHIFTVAAQGFRSNAEMNVNGSVTPVVFAVTPPAGTKWHIRGMDLSMLDNTAMDDSTFAGITALPKGLVFRKKNGDYHSFFNIKTNGEFALRATTYEYSAKAPAGFYGLNVEFDFLGHFGTVVMLDADAGDYLEVLVQDDLSAVNFFRATISGHVVVD